MTAAAADHAPWSGLPADSKTHRRLAIASIVLGRLEQVQLAYPDPHPALKTG